MSISLDFTDVQGFDLIPKNTYNARVSEVELKESSTGNPYLAWKYEIEGGEFNGRTMFDNTSLVAKALWKVKGVLTALVPDLKIDGTFELTGDFLTSLIGKPCRIVVTHEKYEGEDRARVKNVLKPEGADGSVGGNLPFQV